MDNILYMPFRGGKKHEIDKVILYNNYLKSLKKNSIPVPKDEHLELAKKIIDLSLTHGVGFVLDLLGMITEITILIEKSK